MILSAQSLTLLQQCPRKFLLDYDWTVLRLRPKQLLDACLRKGILEVSQGKDAAAVAESLKADFLQAAANPGMDTLRGANPWVIAKDSCAVIDTVVRAAARWGLPPLFIPVPVPLNSAHASSASHAWLPLAFRDAAGTLHRFITVSRWTEDDLVRELHGWYTVGDVAACDAPMTIHVIVIGQTRGGQGGGRRASPWCRAFRHPAMSSLPMRFAKKDGSPLAGWRPVYLADGRGDPDAWVAQLYSEKIAQSLVRRVEIAAPDAAARSRVLSGILQESARAGVLVTERGSGGWAALPMARSACDDPRSPCTFQHVCYEYTQNPVNIGGMGLYTRREAGEWRGSREAWESRAGGSGELGERGIRSRRSEATDESTGAGGNAESTAGIDRPASAGA